MKTYRLKIEESTGETKKYTPQIRFFAWMYLDIRMEHGEAILSKGKDCFLNSREEAIKVIDSYKNKATVLSAKISYEYF